MYFAHMPNPNFPTSIQRVSLIDPYVVQTLQSVIGKKIIVDTVRGTIEGNLVDVKPDHIVLQDNKKDLPKFVRIAQIVYIMPLPQ